MIPVWVLLLVVSMYPVLMVASFRAGMRLARQRSRQAICGCGHHWAFHEGVARCRAWTKGRGNCLCQNYIGPEPMPKFLMPHMTEEVDK